MGGGGGIKKQRMMTWRLLQKSEKLKDKLHGVTCTSNDFFWGASALYSKQKRVHRRCETQVHCTFTGPPQMRNEACTLYSQRESTAEHVRWSMAKAHARDAARIRHLAQTRACSKNTFSVLPPLALHRRGQRKDANERRRCACNREYSEKRKKRMHAGESDGLYNLS